MNKIIYNLFFILFSINCVAQSKITVGAKHFNEGYILSELIAQVIENEGLEVERKFNLGGTTIAFEALKNRNIDVYPEYTGTIASEILKDATIKELDALRAKTENLYNLTTTNPFGFNNTYAIVVNKSLAKELNIKSITDLKLHPNIIAGLSPEFISRNDGWLELSKTYQLTNKANSIEHGIAYQALLNKSIDFTDAYSTDGEIIKHDFVSLIDDKQFFPEYKAVAFYQNKLPANVIASINKLVSQISEIEMQRMNAVALEGKLNFHQIANQFLVSKKIIAGNVTVAQNEYWDFVSHLLQHLFLTIISIVVSVIIAVPLGIYIFKTNRFIKPILFISSIFQTIPSIALLALFIPLFGIGKLPAIVALCTYALLPILRNTITGLQNIDPQLKFVATAIGLNTKQVLKYVEFPLALPTVITGIRIAAVINVGTATLAAFIGAGGLGEYIVTGLALNNTSLILKGAIPSAILAIIIELIFDFIEQKKSQHLKSN